MRMSGPLLVQGVSRVLPPTDLKQQRPALAAPDTPAERWALRALRLTDLIQLSLGTLSTSGFAET